MAALQLKALQLLSWHDGSALKPVHPREKRESAPTDLSKIKHVASNAHISLTKPGLLLKQADAVTVIHDRFPFFHEGFLSFPSRLRFLLRASAQGRIHACYTDDDHKTYHVLGTLLSIFFKIFLFRLHWVSVAVHRLSQLR